MTAPDPITLGDQASAANLLVQAARIDPYLLNAAGRVDTALRDRDAVLAYLRDLADRIDRQEDDGLDDEAGRGFSEFDLVDAVKSLVRREGEQ